MNDAIRPSGATLCVVKKFSSKEDFEQQLLLMRAAKGLGLEVSAGKQSGPLEFRMPLARPIGPEHAMDLVATYQWLWSLTNPRPDCSLHAYDRYVKDRPVPPGAGALFNRALRLAIDSYPDANDAAAKGPKVGFVHGDATASNAVSTADGVRLIDFSPRPTPAYAELDVAKLIFSGLGFDTGPELGNALLSALGHHADSDSLLKLPPLTRYFLATHVVRVMSKEPPETLERVRFYQRVLNILENQQ